MARMKRLGIANWRLLLLGAVLLGAGSLWLVSLARAQGGITVQFSAANYNANEMSTATVTVTLSQMSMSQVTVNYSTSDGTAVAPGDYTATSGQLTFAPFQTSMSFGVPILDDFISEPAETVNLTLSSPIGATLGSQSTATITIIDNDPPPTVQFSASDYSIVEGTVLASITVMLSGPSSQTVTVNYATANGTAVSPDDYQATSGTVTFSPGAISQTFTVQIWDDFIVEPAETVSLTLSSPVNATLGAQASSTLWILDNDLYCFLWVRDDEKWLPELKRTYVPPLMGARA